MTPDNAGEPHPADKVLMVLVASSPTMLDDLITVILDLGLTGATVIETKGLSSILREEMPIFAGLAALLPQNSGSRLLFSITTRAHSDRMFNYIERQLKPSERPIAFTTPIDRVSGLDR